MNKDIKFPYYSGNIRLSKAMGHVNLDDFILFCFIGYSFISLSFKTFTTIMYQKKEEHFLSPSLLKFFTAGAYILTGSYLIFVYLSNKICIGAAACSGHIDPNTIIIIMGLLGLLIFLAGFILGILYIFYWLYSKIKK